MGAAVALTAVSMVMGHSAQRKQAKAQRQQEAAQRAAAKANQRIADIKARQARVQAAREQRRVVATQQNIATSSAVSSSGQSGFIGSIQSQYSSALASAGQVESISRESSIFNNAASARASSLYGSAANFAQFADLAKGGATMASIWDKQGASDMFA